MSSNAASDAPVPPRGPRHWPVWFGVAICMGLARLPWSVQRRLGAGVGWLALRLSRSRREAARANLALCLPGERKRRGVHLPGGRRHAHPRAQLLHGVFLDLAAERRVQQASRLVAERAGGLHGRGPARRLRQLVELLARTAHERQIEGGAVERLQQAAHRCRGDASERVGEQAGLQVARRLALAFERPQLRLSGLASLLLEALHLVGGEPPEHVGERRDLGGAGRGGGDSR